MRVAALQFDIVWEDKKANHRIIEDMLRAANLAEGTYVLLPELCDTGFSFDLDKIVDEQTLPWATVLAESLKIWLQPGFARIGPDGKGRNCTAIISPTGDVLGIYEKVHPFTYSREGEHYSGGNELLTAICSGVMICPTICYDLRFPELWRVATLSGTELFTIGANWPASRQTHFKSLIIARAIENQVYVLAANRIGEDPSLQYQGGSIFVSPKGEIIAEAQSQAVVLQADLDLSALRFWRKDFPALKDIKNSLLGSIKVNSIAAIDSKSD